MWINVHEDILVRSHDLEAFIGVWRIKIAFFGLCSLPGLYDFSLAVGFELEDVWVLVGKLTESTFKEKYLQKSGKYWRLRFMPIFTRISSEIPRFPTFDWIRI